MDDLSEADFQKEEEPASPAPPPSQQHTDPASPTVAVTPEPVARGEQATPSEIEYQVRDSVCHFRSNPIYPTGSRLRFTLAEPTFISYFKLHQMHCSVF